MNKRNEVIAFYVKIVLDTELWNKKYHFLKMAYDKLGLYDNKRIIAMNKTHAKKIANLTDGVYENIIAIIIEEIKEKDNKDLLELFMKYYSDRMPFAKEIFLQCENDWKKYFDIYTKKMRNKDITEHGYFVLYYLVYGKENDEYLNYVWNCKMEDIEPFADMLEKRTYIEELEKLWKIEDLANNKIYQRYLKKQREILTQYLKIEPQKLEKYIVNLSVVSKMDEEEIVSFAALTKGVPFGWIEKSLLKILDKYNISTDCMVANIDESYTRIVSENFENLCGALIYSKYYEYKSNEEELTLSMVNRQASIENPETFFLGLLASYYFELLTIVLNNLLNSYYKIFSFDKILNANRERELIAELNDLRDEAHRYKEKLKEYVEVDFEHKQKQYSETKKEDRGYVEKIALLEKQLEGQKKLNEKQQQRLQDQEEYISLLKLQEEEESQEVDLDVSIFCGKRIVFIGGMQELLVKLKPIFTNSVFIHDEAVVPPSNIDAIVMFPKFMNHVLFYKYIALAREKEIKVIYCNSNNVDIVLGEIGKKI